MTPDLRDAALAKLTDSAGHPLDPNGCVAAIRAVLELHSPSHRHAGVKASLFGEGCCAYCARHGEPIEVYRDHLNGSARKVEMHCHGVMDEPWCNECITPDGDSPSWPCEHVKRIAAALSVSA